MALAARTRLGPYEIVAPLGAGGMGEVYRARDTRLGRQVAIKVLPSGAMATAEQRARFEREARAIAGLNHPHICSLHDVGRSDGIDFLVMELVEGETLASRLARGPLPLADVLRFGSQIADALQRAHRSGIVHRDLKPGNVMLSSGDAKLMDFGLARPAGQPAVTEPGDSRSPTEASPITGSGVLLGTYQYMAPEQLEGKDADARSDIWALGATLYEMATGHRAFAGQSAASLISSIMKEQPRSLLELAPLSPPELHRLVTSCIEKNPDHRWQSAGDLARELRWLLAEGSGGAAPTLQPFAGIRKPHGGRGTMLAAGLVAVATMAALVVALLRIPPAPRLVKSTLLFPSGTLPVIPSGGYALSPDGSAVAVTSPDSTGAWRLYVRRLSEGRVSVVSDSHEAYLPFWSPDSREIGFATGEGKLARVSASGGPTQIIADAPDFEGGAWTSDGWIVFNPRDGSPLMRVRASGGIVEPATELDSARGESRHTNPMMLPDGRHFLFVVFAAGEWQHFRIRVGSTGSRASHDLLEADAVPRCSPDGWLVFIRDRALFAQRVDPRGDHLIGEPMPLPESPARQTALGLFTPGAVLGRDVMAYATDDSRPTVLQWFDLAGRAGRIAARLPGPFGGVSVSPDGRRAVIHFIEGKETNVWLVDLESGTSSRLTPVEEVGRHPVWCPDGRHIVYERIGEAGQDLRILNVDDPRDARTVLKADGIRELVEPCFALDDSGSVFIHHRDAHGADLMERTMGASTRTVLSSEFGAYQARLLPDRKWIVYATSRSGRVEIYGARYPDLAQPVRLTQELVGDVRDTGRFWLAGNTLFYFASDGSTLRRVELRESGDALVPGPPTGLFTLPTEWRGVWPDRDGQRVLVAHPLGAPQLPSLELVQNWKLELAKP